MSVARDRKHAAKVLGLALQVRYRRLLQAVGEDEIAAAAVELGSCFNSNIEQIVWFLKEYGGVEQLPLERLGHRPAPIQDGLPDITSNLPEMPALLAAGRDVDMPK